MSRLRRITAAAVVSAMVAGFTLTFTAPVAASDGTSTTTTAICRVLNAAEAALACLPDGKLKSYLQAQIDAAELKNGCS